jgi:uncharacterized protein YxeA
MKKIYQILTVLMALIILGTGTIVYAEEYGSYQEALDAYKKAGYKRITKIKKPIIVEAESFINEGMEREPRSGEIPKVEIVADETANGGKYVTNWKERYHYLDYKVTVPESGLYSISFRYRIPRSERETGFFIRAITINDEEPFAQAGRLTLPKGETMPGSSTLIGDPYFDWIVQKVKGQMDQYVEEPYLFYFEKNKQYTIRLTSRGGGIDFDYFAISEAHKSTPKALVGLKRMWDLLLASFKAPKK